MNNGRTKPRKTPEPKVKVEDKLDETALTRLATGVSVDAAAAGGALPPPKAEKPCTGELRNGYIQIVPVINDGQPASSILLTGLKTLFQKQLPKMPREYIARLVYDTNSRGLAIIKRGLKVVGGVLFRPFPQRGFAEIVFFATASVDQVKGYGAMLMDHFKMHIRKIYPDMQHFLTYADNYAVGYFEKQGFSKEISLDRAVWAGYIKDYEGGTIMQCTMLRKVDYLEKQTILRTQHEAVMTKIREFSHSEVVHPGIAEEVWARAMEGKVVKQEGQVQIKKDEMVLSPQDVPGLKETNWTADMISVTQVPRRNPDYTFMERLLQDLQSHSQAWPFLKPVSKTEVPDYYEVIKEPMDFEKMDHKLTTLQYHNVDEFVTDAQLVFDNCRVYNPETTVYAKAANRLEKFMKDRLAAAGR
ncbi:hypothetical protein BD626DRAFT_392727 [Schizophyllum amplum]|uniref:histone acetyltransferase n=1 Tax=Schizophyllum amplum TaxID=97359 RepID=A0A550CX34_9AGAR|nr:hypothetical protein BD626DRAFT_392727 [Auriculariopsis ampla]